MGQNDKCQSKTAEKNGYRNSLRILIQLFNIWTIGSWWKQARNRSTHPHTHTSIRFFALQLLITVRYVKSQNLLSLFFSISLSIVWTMASINHWWNVYKILPRYTLELIFAMHEASKRKITHLSVLCIVHSASHTLFDAITKLRLNVRMRFVDLSARCFHPIICIFRFLIYSTNAIYVYNWAYRLCASNHNHKHNLVSCTNWRLDFISAVKLSFDIFTSYNLHSLNWKWFMSSTDN